MGGFREFLFRGNLVQLAVAVIIGASFGALVTAFTTGLITPLLGIFGAQPKFSELHFTINNSQFNYGNVIDALVAFFITALILYYIVVVPSNWVMAKFEKAEAATNRPCPECFSTINKQATRCAFCTTVVLPIPEEEKEVEDKEDKDKAKAKPDPEPV